MESRPPCRVPSFCYLAAILCNLWPAFSGEIGVTLQWDANPEPEVVGYHAYVGTESGRYDRMIDAGPETSARISPLDPGVTYYFVVTAYTSDRVESPFSDEIVYTVRIDGTNAMVKPVLISMMNGTSPVTVSFNAKPGRRYFLQTSSDLHTWRTEEAFVFEMSSGVFWRDPDGRTRPMRFYRVVAQIP